MFQNAAVATPALSPRRGLVPLHPLGRSPLVLLFFSPDEPCLACEPKFAIEHIREFEFQGSFRRQLFGARRVQNQVEVFTERFGEFDGDHMLWAAI
ncbi:hypothetical protein [Diaphorobacter aerolatus]|uniref:Uncharacterized protein n=1 Tax=Diaphorobacter aerolatus TaxID=1288495 RepID=A0A7H0GHR3_9BURK|nr:hypothetical protein [Diaphorobacter aerolatus]QNP47829.1 hypothetical protein H9K75_16995 [Diaphorobacter aerolatus]